MKPTKKQLTALAFAFLLPMTANASLWTWLGFGKDDTAPAQSQNQSHNVHNHDHIHGDDGHEHDIPVAERQIGTAHDYQMWLRTRPYDAQKAQHYERFLRQHLGAEVPPMHELLTTARSWQACGYEPYEVPPPELWNNMLPTLKLYNRLKWQGILPSTTQIRSVYRNPMLNRCAGGASSSKHLINGAIDIWVPEYGDNSDALFTLKDRLCRFWQDEGRTHNFGLGLYATGAIHLDTHGYRKWGMQFSRSNSPCQEEQLYIDGQF